MRLIIGGDLVPTHSNIELFSNGEVNTLLGKELLSLWKSTDIRILNLEVPLTDKEDPIPKSGPNLIAPTSTVKGIKALDPSLLSLANNHILDQGVQGLKSTERVLSEYEIPFVGVGDTLCTANKPYILEQSGLKIGVYACAEYEFTIATQDEPGANPFDPLESLDHIVKLKETCDYVVVLYHGGKEHYRYPSPYLQKVCRKMAQKGADLIVCQHSHCIGCYEEYKGATIVYGQGNFIFDRSKSEFWQTSLLVKVTFENEIGLEYIPIVKKENTIQLATGKVAENILFAFQQRSKDIVSEEFVSQQYQQFAEENYLLYVRHFAGFGKWLSRLDRYIFKDMLAKRKYNKKQLLAIQNFIECEAHRELVIAGIKYKREKIK
ncbi:CapA family protein [Schinkia azotoformans]|uniref:CapA family protein n=1 Tax=Schinkia azotoformans TaxID=1454 RepID=UPI002DB94E48|nr:CapA family protein [Schinkia azotoformans]MEC1760391.1 CapA family protein [Schinkia azotoformans]